MGALVAFTISPIILWYSGTIFTECLYDEDGQGRKIRIRSGYKDLGEALLPRYRGILLSAFIQIDLSCLSVAYLVVLGSAIHHSLHLYPSHSWSGLTCIAGGLVLPATFLTESLSPIAWLSVISVFALVAVVVAVVWYGA